MFVLVFMLDWSASRKSAKTSPSSGHVHGHRRLRDKTRSRPQKGVDMASKSPKPPTGRIYFPDELRLLQEIFNDCTAGGTDRADMAAAKRLMDAYEHGIRDEKLLRVIAVGKRPRTTPRGGAMPRHHAGH